MRLATICLVIVMRFILRFPMPLIHRMFLMRLNELAMLVVDLLPKAQCRFICVHFLHVAGAPALAAGNVSPIAAPALRQVFPSAELPLVLRSSSHRRTPSIAHD